MNPIQTTGQQIRSGVLAALLLAASVLWPVLTVQADETGGSAPALMVASGDPKDGFAD